MESNAPHPPPHSPSRTTDPVTPSPKLAELVTTWRDSPRWGRDAGRGTHDDLRRQYERNLAALRQRNAQDWTDRLFRAARDGWRLGRTKDQLLGELESALKAAGQPGDRAWTVPEGVEIRGGGLSQAELKHAGEGATAAEVVPWVIESEPAPVDWTADPRWGDDDHPIGTLDDLKALVQRRVAEIIGPDAESLAGQLFRHERDRHRLGEVIGWDGDGAESAIYDPALDGVFSAVFGAIWDDPETGESVYETQIEPHWDAGQNAAKAHPWQRTDDRTISLPALLAEHSEDPEFLVGDVWPHGGKVMLVAPAKAGKSTTVGNIVRALADGTPLLERWPVAELGDQDTICVFDVELTRGQVRRWLDRQGIQHPHRVHVANLRGQTWDIRDPAVRAEWAEYLRRHHTRIIVVDPLGPLLAAHDISDISNTAVGGYLHALDALVVESRASELLVVHHAGHGSERGRGASILRGWPDVELTLSLAGEEASGSATRYLRAFGRDVDVPETALAFDDTTKRLRVVTGDRRTIRAEKGSAAVLEAVTAAPGLTATALADQVATSLGEGRNTGRDAVRAAKAGGLVHVHPGRQRAEHHYPGEACPGGCGSPNTTHHTPSPPERQSAPPPTGGLPESSAPPPYRWRTHSQTQVPDPSSAPAGALHDEKKTA